MSTKFITTSNGNALNAQSMSMLALSALTFVNLFVRFDADLNGALTLLGRDTEDTQT